MSDTLIHWKSDILKINTLIIGYNSASERCDLCKVDLRNDFDLQE